MFCSKKFPTTHQPIKDMIIISKPGTLVIKASEVWDNFKVRRNVVYGWYMGVIVSANSRSYFVELYQRKSNILNLCDQGFSISIFFFLIVAPLIHTTLVQSLETVGYLQNVITHAR